MKNIIIFIMALALVYFVILKNGGTDFRVGNKVVSLNERGVTAQPVENFVATEVANGLVNGAKQVANEIENESARNVEIRKPAVAMNNRENVEIPVFTKNLTKKDKINFLNNLRSDFTHNTVSMINNNSNTIDFAKIKCISSDGNTYYFEANNLLPGEVRTFNAFHPSKLEYVNVFCKAYDINFEIVKPIR